MSKKEQSFLLPVIILIIAIAGFLIADKLLLPAIAENQAKISAYESDIEKAQAKLDSIGAADKTMTQFSDLVNNLLIAVPDSVDSPNLITEIETIASQNQVALPSITPPEDIKSGENQGLSVNISVAGSFQNINNFISGLETSIRFSKITTLTITLSEEKTLGAAISFEVYKRPASSRGGE